jgi:prepilin-type N-terminal cleavage/methylation domain-containing protein
MPDTNRNAFTLIELLIVILIIAIMAALLVPGVMAIIRSANVTKCKNNLSQLYTFVGTYRSEFGGPDYLYPDATGQTFWQKVYNAYETLGKGDDVRSVWTCPVAGGNNLNYNGPVNQVYDGSPNNTILGMDLVDNHGGNEGCIITIAKSLVELKGNNWTSAVASGLEP